jgi:hypothetical protein
MCSWPWGGLNVRQVYIASPASEKGDGGIVQTPANYDKKTDAVFRAKGLDGKQKQWFVFDPLLVLPEYLVEFEYVLERDRANGVTPDGSIADDGGGGAMVRCLQRFQASLISPSVQKLDAEAAVKSALILPPHVPERSTLAVLDVGEAMRLADVREASHVINLNAISRAIKRVEPLGALQCLRVLNLAFNELARCDAIENLPKLEEVRAPCFCFVTPLLA